MTAMEKRQRGLNGCQSYQLDEIPSRGDEREIQRPSTTNK